MKGRRKKILIWLLSASLTVVLLAMLAHEMDFKQIAEVFSSIDIQYVVYASFFYALVYVFRTYRLTVLYKKEQISFATLFPIHTVHNFYNQLLPGGVGELSFPFLLKKYTGQKMSSGSATVLLIRMSDIIVLLCLFMLFLLKSDTLQKIPFEGGVGLLTMLVGGVVLCGVCLVLFSPKLSNWIVRREGTIPVTFSFFVRLLTTFARFSDKKIFLKILCISFLSNIATILTHWALLKSVGIPISIFQAGAATALIIPVFLLPVRGVAGFGTLEGGWALALWLVGIDKGMGIMGGFAVHILSLGFMLILAIYGFFRLSFKSTKMRVAT